ncbi:thioredoxin [uncultured Megasphaera sp.]|uniref:thioredoxin n=1 Tax=uncultured Megasphaera sp. TaxID=165188 RepID=UPI0025D9D0BE|nr:thioredoxin [uncultured Megasphaera sp.]
MAIVSIDSDSDFSVKVFHQPGIVVVDFWAPWCGPCKMVHAEVRQAAARFGDAVKVVKVNVDSQRSIAEKYEIMAVPTLLFFKDGKPLKRIIGYASQAEISEFLASLVPKREAAGFDNKNIGMI